MGWTITWEEFMSLVTDFVSISDREGDGWMWQGNKNVSGGAYVCKRVVQQMPEKYCLPVQDENEPFEDDTLQNEDTVTQHYLPKHSRECTWEYHVLYSPSYGTPVLYFNAFTSDGKLLTLETLWMGFISESGTQEALQLMRWEALSQQEHPILRRPFFQLHPCKTAEFLGNLQEQSSNSIVTWLSSIGPSVGLHIPNVYSCLVNQKNR